MAKQGNLKDFLTDEGRGIYAVIKDHCEGLGIWNDGFDLELRLLANSFSLYFDAAVTCNREGTSVEVGNQGYKQVSPDYVVMKTEYKNITTHAAKFGLNPADLKRVFDKLEDDKKTVKKGFETGPMKVAK